MRGVFQKGWSFPSSLLPVILTEYVQIVFCTLKEMSEHDLGPPLHSMILPGHMHPLEVDMLNTFKISDEKLS